MLNPQPQDPLIVVEPSRPRWSDDDVLALYEKPFNDLVFEAQSVHRAHFDPNQVQLSSLLSIKTGACPEDCKYCPQSARYKTGLQAERLMRLENIVSAAKQAKQAGATRFCMGAAWRSPKDKDLSVVEDAIRQVKELGMETCATLGMLDDEQAARLRSAGLDYYNHNLDTSESFYSEIITTRTFQDRLDTLERVRGAGINVCSGGIVGMGETRRDRASMLATLASLPEPPQSVPINNLIRVAGTPLEDSEPVDEFEFVRTVAVARITMPKSYVRLSAGREAMNDQMQSLCFLAGANSIFYGEELLTTGNASVAHDKALLSNLGMAVEV
ncbi:biotin synthase [Arenicella chitinivorans]|uniref:Biotin synthase n=1 Tax=Arenicella chitinivorans TaxID=1329800 RepID=A0A918RMV5_9GAMM|nr:biotin synthase [Arenicella chitinivorans]